MSTFALVIETPETIQKTKQRIHPFVEAVNLPLLDCTTAEAAQEIFKKQDVLGFKPAVILIGPNFDSPVVAVRRLYPEVPLAHFAFLTSGENSTLIKKLKSPVAMIGSYWSIENLNTEDVARNLRNAAHSAQQRLYHRTTLQRINRKLNTYGSVDLSEFQKFSVSDRFLANLLENAQDAIIATNKEGIIINWNKAAEEMFALTEEQAVGQFITGVAGGEWSDQLPHLVSQILSTKTSTARQELEFRRLDGRTLTVDLMLSFVRDEPGELIGVSAIVRDITERKKLEKQIQQAQKLESLSVLAGGIAHDFNNILTGILVGAELALQKISPASPIQVYLEKIEQSAVRAADLSKQMLAYSGKGHFFLQPLSINQIVADVETTLTGLVSQSAVIEYHLSPDNPKIEADPNQMRQVLINLVTNASEATGDKGGLIIVSTGVVDCDAHYLSQIFLNDNLQPGRYTYLEVTDTGIGMDKENQDKIFDPFFTTKFTGRGLGLAAVFGIVRGHGGAIHLQSEPGQGTTFRILFPGGKEAKVQTQVKPIRVDAFQAEGTILVVDDEESLRDAVSEVLEFAGFNILTAVDGRAGLDLFMQTKDDLSLVILDLTMPQLDGEAVFKEIRQLAPTMPVILTSGYSETEIRPRFAGKGLTGFLQKPFNQQKLLAAVKEALGNHFDNFA